jgi:hypothetical protein
MKRSDDPQPPDWRAGFALLGLTSLVTATVVAK